MVDLRQGTIRVRDGAPPGAALSYTAARLGGTSVDGERAGGAAAPANASGFLDELYAAAVEHSRLSEALRQFTIAFDADDACLFNADGVPPHDHVAVVERSAPMGAPRFLCDDDAIASGLFLTQELAETLAGAGAELWTGVVRTAAADVRMHHRHVARTHYLAIAPRSNGDTLIGVVALREFPFADADIERARLLLPDIRRALNLRRHAGRVEALGLGVQLFDRNPAAIFITRQRAIERSNVAASTLLAAGRPVSVASGKLHFEDSRVHAAFELISRADAQAQGNKAFAFVVDGVDGGTWIAQLSPVRQASHSNTSPGANIAGVVVALTPFNSASQTRETMLNGFTDLTPTERTIFAAFVDGQDISAIAARLNRSVETVRWHVRNLFTKLGVNSQADLARLGALLLPI